MGRLNWDETDRITLEGGEWVDIKQRMSHRDVQRLAMSYTQLGEIVGTDRVISRRVDVETPTELLLRLNIMAWSFIYKGEPVPINEETLGRLDPDDARLIEEEVNKRNPNPFGLEIQKMKASISGLKVSKRSKESK